ncbi:MAG: hypothetical protein QOG97_2759, partial [Acidimicrobiaceae bacterium]|nr:hypothetical protein [Acidimicrobiaceae bacterium]
MVKLAPVTIPPSTKTPGVPLRVRYPLWMTESAVSASDVGM